MNLIKYPKFKQVRWQYANMTPGDCLFLPYSKCNSLDQHLFRRVYCKSVESVWGYLQKSLDPEFPEQANSGQMSVYAGMLWRPLLRKFPNGIWSKPSLNPKEGRP